MYVHVTGPWEQQLAGMRTNNCSVSCTVQVCTTDSFSQVTTCIQLSKDKPWLGPLLRLQLLHVLGCACELHGLDVAQCNVSSTVPQQDAYRAG
jgi:hypothetical protein